ncbi:pilus assembly FimT family protein [Deinococcus enclensis]|uniref:Prepilin-type N-terminal cleavage/methylation domain-containing protein n=1 Tax=Deinococcus enclensis TaxID=1049582 RepID=A0ABT9MB57_9DEIO|nr:prepilin-type N-terminal cleavage/methylation domain-containing protein [Deinococcus enclensis]MDP9763822.1 prepilin-type N-terminal cleavage/methylation domain-containing protein [Deinococcus enclensis]
MKTSGFTLVELLIVIGMIGVLMAVAIPNYLTWLASSQTSRDAQTLVREIQQARTLARRGTAQRLTTTANSSVVTITPVAFASSAWSPITGATVRTVTLEGAKVGAARTLVFTPPYGAMDTTVSTTPQTFTLTSTRRSTTTRTVDVISLMGKAVIR